MLAGWPTWPLLLLTVVVWGYLFWGEVRRRQNLVGFGMQLLGSLREGIVVTNREGRIVYINPAWAASLGYGESDLLGQDILDLCYPPDRGILDAAWGRRTKGHSEVYRHRVLTQSGEVLWVEASAVPWYRQGKVMGSVVAVRNVHQDQENRERLERVNKLLLGVTQSSQKLLQPSQQLPIPEVLAILAQAAGAERAYWFERIDQAGEVRFAQRHEWCAAGVSPQINNPEMQNVTADPAWLAAFLRGEPVYMTASEFPPTIRSMLEAQQIRSLIEVPVLVEGELRGLLGLDDCTQERRWGSEEVAVMVAAAASLGEAISRMQAEAELRSERERYRELLEQSQAQTEELSLMLQLRRDLSPDLSREEVFRKAVEVVAQTFGYLLVSAYIRQGQELVLQHQVGYKRFFERLPLGDGVAARAVLSGQAQWVQEASQEKGFVFAEPDVRSEVAVPLWVRGEVVGVLSVESREVLDQHDFELLQSIGPYVGLVLERTELHRSLSEQEQLYRNLLEILPASVLLFDRDIVRYANPEAQKVYGAPGQDLVGQPLTRFNTPGAPLSLEAYLQVFDGHEVPLVEDRTTNLRGEVVDVEVSLRPVQVLGETLALMVSRDINARKQAEAALRRSEARFRAMVQNSYDVTAILKPDGQIMYISPNVSKLGYDPLSFNQPVNVLDFVHPLDQEMAKNLLMQAVLHPGQGLFAELRSRRSDGGYSWFEIRAQSLMSDPDLAGIVLNLRDVSERKTYQAQIEHLAYHDPLTALPNRRLLRERAEHLLPQAQRGRREVALLYFDLDRFKEVNDTLGHDAGDQLLRAVADRVGQSIRAGDTLARLGGDEFGLLLADTSEEGAAQAAKRVLDLLHAPIELLGQTLRVTASIGIAIFPRDGQSLEALLRASDIAMYRAKKQKDSYTFYSADQDPYTLDRLSLIQDLRDALDHQSFLLHYQPILSFPKRDIQRVEVLVRWLHPQRGLISPEWFIPLAEELGLIVQLDRWVLRQALLEMARTNLQMSVNLSAFSLAEPLLVQWIQEALQETGVPANRLWIEITETALMHNLSQIQAHLAALALLGVRVSLDDFGSGYSSLSYIKHLSLQGVKIDRIFSNGIGKDSRDEAVIRAVVELARGLEIEVAMEGIENQEQLRWVEQVGCQQAQGFLIAKPLSQHELLLFLSAKPAL